MLRVNSISNVNNTLNNISFKAGVQTNYGLQSNTPTMAENTFIAGFVGALKEGGLLGREVQARAQKIEKGLNNKPGKLDLIA